MKVLIVGYGSMGRRRARLVKRIRPETVFIIVDSRTDRRIQAESENYKTYENLDNALEELPIVAFVCTSPREHISIAKTLVSKGVNVFLELNLCSEGYDDLEKIAQRTNTSIFMSSTLLYDKSIQMIKSKVERIFKPLLYTYHVGQYLPDWHPWESYKDFFVSEKSTNAVREIMAIQLPWIIATFGSIEEIKANWVKCTKLDIGFDDGVVLIVKHENGNMGSIVFDVASRKPVTALEVIGEDIYLRWHGHSDDLFEFDLNNKKEIQIESYKVEEHMDMYADNINENRYLDEIIEFLKTVIEKKKPIYTLEDDKYVLSIIDKIEEGQQ